MRFPRFALVSLILAVPAFAASPLQEKVRAWRVAHERELIDEYREFLAIPNITVDRANIRRNADYLVAGMKRRGIDARLLTIPSPNLNPVVFGEVRVPGATRTLMLYAHYDGQPLDPKEWATPPFTPTLLNRKLEDGGQAIPLPDRKSTV